MSFLRRALGGDRAPEWASFMSGDEYRAFAQALEQDMETRGWRRQITDAGSVVVDRGSGKPDEFGLFNLAQLCHQLDRSKWAAAIGAHFTNLAAAEAAGEQLAEFAYAEPMLKVRVYRASEMPPEALAGMVTTPLAPDLVGVLVADLPTTVQTLGRETVSGWGVPIDELFRIATRQMAEEAATYDLSDLDLGGGASAKALSGDSFFVGSQIIRFRELAGELPQGALVVIPTRHILLWHPISTAEATVRAVNSMIALGTNLYSQGPGSITPTLFWWHGALTVLPAAVDGGKVQFAPPDEFMELLNSLS
ncbi:MAG: hypothetical protein L0221_02645 [Chloroflexi bacterium]|nr:hypothetical protein [Chloroflexota bacterium]